MRKQLSAKRRFDVFKRDGFACHYCGSTPPSVILHVDHITPVSSGGGNEIDNLITSCQRCNLGKNKELLSSIPESLKNRAKEIREKEAQILAYSAVLNERNQRIEKCSWEVVRRLEGNSTREYSRAGLHSIRKFLGRLPFEELLEAADTAQVKFPRYYQENDRFRYFCGICWCTIRGNENGRVS